MRQTITCVLGIFASVGLAVYSLYAIAFFVWLTAAEGSQAKIERAQVSAYLWLGVLGISFLAAVALALRLWCISRTMKKILTTYTDVPCDERGGR